MTIQVKKCEMCGEGVATGGLMVDDLNVCVVCFEESKLGFEEED